MLKKKEKITECDRNIGGLKGNCFLSSFVIKIYIYIYIYIFFFCCFCFCFSFHIKACRPVSLRSTEKIAGVQGGAAKTN